MFLHHPSYIALERNGLVMVILSVEIDIFEKGFRNKNGIYLYYYKSKLC